MCGIIGYVGNRKAKDILLNGLKKLEYRGYDSAGLVVFHSENPSFIEERAVGKITELEKKIKNMVTFDDNYKTGIGHTRWATHGGVEECNAHPQFDEDKKIFLVHNGIIENYKELKKFLLQKKDYHFSSETDTEVLTQLISYLYEGDLFEATKKALKLTEGAYGIAVMHVDEPNTIIAARNGSPLILGVGNKEMFVASDPQAISLYTNHIVFLDDNEVAKITLDEFQIFNLKSDKTVDREIEEISMNISELEKNGYDYYMLKEIFEQPTTIEDTYKGKIDFINNNVHISGLFLTPKEVKQLDKVVFLACGSSWHVGLIGKYLVEKLARIPAECEYASEYRYRYPVINPNSLFVAISQSGETADTIAAMKLIKEKGGDIFGITNVVGSSISRETKGGMYIHAGHENGVAATKTFTSQLMAALLLAISLAKMNNMLDSKKLEELLTSIALLPKAIESVLQQKETLQKIAAKYENAHNALFLGRDLNFPIALEGALKLKEISYLHAEGYPAAEMKHGPLALVDENMPCFVIATKDSLYKKVISNIQEVRARKGKIIVIATVGDTEIESFADDVIFVPELDENVQPIVNIIPLQLISYFIATKRGIDVDRPRNLAKSVTVE